MVSRGSAVARSLVVNQIRNIRMEKTEEQRYAEEAVALAAGGLNLITDGYNRRKRVGEKRNAKTIPGKL